MKLALHHGVGEAVPKIYDYFHSSGDFRLMSRLDQILPTANGLIHAKLDIKGRNKNF